MLNRIKQAVFFILILNCAHNISAQEIQSTEVSFNVDDIVLAGTLTTPQSTENYPIVILISGGNADDRDESLGNFKPFEEISIYLAKHGIASLRYDDRGIGKSTGLHTWQYTIHDYSNDVLATINFIKSNSEINYSQIGLIGHCLGGHISLITSSLSDDIDFMAILTTPIFDGDQIFIDTRAGYFESIGKSQNQIDDGIKLDHLIFETVRNNGDISSITDSIIKQYRLEFNQLPADIKSNYPDFDSYFAMSYDGTYFQILETPYYKHFIDYSPKKYIEANKTNTLIILGEGDYVVPLQKNLAQYKEYSKDKSGKYTIVTIPSIDHYFVKDWSKPTVDESVLSSLTLWIKFFVSKNK